MANSKFIITFVAMPEVNDSFTVTEELLSLSLYERFRINRTAMFQTKVPSSYNAAAEGDPPLYLYSGFVSQNYKTSFDLDYNSTGLFTVTVLNGTPGSGLGTVTVEANYPGAVFSFGDLPIGVEIDVFNEAAPEPIEIESIVYSEAEDVSPCQYVKATVTTSVLATKVTSDTQITEPHEASQNLILYSEDLSNAIWGKENTVIDGNKVIGTAVYGYHSIYQSVNKGDSTGPFTFSFFIKEGETKNCFVFIKEAVGSGLSYIGFNTTDKTFFANFNFSGYMITSYSFSDESDGFMRVSITLNTTSSSAIQLRIRTYGLSGSWDYTGDGVSGIYIDKLQFNQGTLLPYIQTTDSTVSVSASDGTVIDPNINNPFVINLLRSQSGTLTVENSEGSQYSQLFQAPPPLNASNFSLNINNSPNGATVTVLSQNSEGLEIEYSLDGDTWQTSNIFSGLAEGDFTLSVRDQLGCSFTMDFNVNSTAIYTPHFYISKSNSIRFAQRITHGDAVNYKNDENTLSCEVEVPNPFHEVQLFQTADVIKTQFQSNYTTNEAKVVKDDLTEVNLPVTQITNNIGIKDKRDARKYNLGDGKVGIYFLAGNTYDYNTDAVNGTHALNGWLPEWGIVGNYINILGSWFIIERIIFDEAKNADVLVITETYTGSEINVITGSIYNLENYEVYEFSIDMVDYIDENISVKLLNSDPNFTALEHVSEDIYVAIRHQNTKDIYYWNDDNNDVYYASGIRHRIRIPYTKVEGLGDEESEIHKTDVNTVLLSAELYEVKRFIFEPCTEEIWTKLKMALSHKNVYIDEVRYVKSGDFESDGPLDDSNLYVLKATMIKAGNVYNSSGSSTGSGTNSTGANIPGLLEGDAGFISY